MSSHTCTLYLCIENQVFKVFKQDTKIEMSYIWKLKRQRMWARLSSEAIQAIHTVFLK
jgi:hypothetical protein